MSNEVINPDQQFLDANGDPLGAGTLTFSVNLQNLPLSTIYSDEALSIPQNNPYTLDASGRILADIKYTGKKRMVVKDVSGAVIRTLDNVSTSFDSNAYIQTIDTYAAIATTALNVDQIINVRRHTSGLYGGGQFIGVAGSVTDDGGTQKNSATVGVYAQRKDMKFVSPEMFGNLSSSTAVVTTRAINKAYVYANANSVPVRYELLAYALDGNIDGTIDGATIVGQGRGGIQIKSNTNTIFTGQTFTQSVSPYTAYSLVNCSNASDFTISGNATFIGDALTHVAVGGADEFGMGLYICNTHNANIKGLTFKTCWGDGVYVSDTDFSTPTLGTNTASSDVTISNCVFQQNRRTGAGVINCKFITFEDCSFIDTGTLIYTSTGAGVDIETDAVANRLGVRELRFNNCRMTGNLGANVNILGTFSDAIQGVYFTDCDMENTSAIGSFWSDSHINYAKNIVVEGGIIKGGVYSGCNTTFNNVKISRSMTDTAVATYVIEMNGASTGSRFNNCEIRAIGDTTINSKKLLFIPVGAAVGSKPAAGLETNKPTFTKCKFVAESVYGGATNILLVTRAPCIFTECEFLTDGTSPASYIGFDTTAGSSRVSPSYAMLRSCYVDPTWHSGITNFQGRVSINVMRSKTVAGGTNNIATALADLFEFTYAAGGASTFNAPTDPFEKTITIVQKNTGAGALGATTWNAVFKMAAWTNPAAGFSRAITFRYDTTAAVWFEISRTTVDVPN